MAGYKIIVGLGNPGRRYAMTRHNVGFRVAERLADKLKLSFVDEERDLRDCAKGKVGDDTLFILKPKTYMNESGNAVLSLAHFFRISPSDILVISDDVALPLGEMRLRLKGSCGGHKGLLSIERTMKTIWYPRLRIGVGDPGQMVLADYVLAPFSPQEEEALLPAIDKAADLALDWVVAKNKNCERSSVHEEK